MRTKFEKYQGIGNDFIILDDPDGRIALEPAIVRRLCDRRFGIGADGVIRATAGSEGGDVSMDYFNSDGSPGEMCGNGIRCLALFARAKGLTTSDALRVETRAGLKKVHIDGDSVRVDMGVPGFSPEEIPIRIDGEDALHAKVEVQGGIFEVACVSMGNPHAVMFVDETEAAPVATLGPLIENNILFPEKTNVEFVEVGSPSFIRMRVWERGSGQTLACGTGACAAAVVSRVLAHTEATVTVSLPGGELLIDWQGSIHDPAPVYMTGPAAKSFDGEVDLAVHAAGSRV